MKKQLSKECKQELVEVTKKLSECLRQMRVMCYEHCEDTYTDGEEAEFSDAYFAIEDATYKLIKLTK